MCPKSEKPKIARSIVVAIRERNGRFLEQDVATNTWFDIGDKKAIEKTSRTLFLKKNQNSFLFFVYFAW